MEKKDTHQLEYSIWSNKVSWCPICLKHFYNERNKMPTTKATKQHYHEVDNSEAKVFQAGNRFRFPDEDEVFTFIVFSFHMGQPVVLYDDDQGVRHHRPGVYLSQLIHSK